MQTLLLILYWSTPAVIALSVIEALVLWAVRRSYNWRAALASLADVLVRQYVVYVYLAFSLASPLIGWAAQHRIATVPLGTAGAIAVLFLGQDLCYYWFHRCSHRLRLLLGQPCGASFEQRLQPVGRLSLRVKQVSRLMGSGQRVFC